MNIQDLKKQYDATHKSLMRAERDLRKAQGALDDARERSAPKWEETHLEGKVLFARNEVTKRAEALKVLSEEILQ
jgi:hypothetical protein